MVGALTLWVDRRCVVRACDCFCLGTAMAAQCSRTPAGPAGGLSTHLAGLAAPGDHRGDPDPGAQSKRISDSLAQRGSGADSW